MIYPCPKPMKVPRERKRLPRTKDSERGRLVRACDATCAALVKSLARFRCERCWTKGPTDWAHGEGRAQAWTLRWAHSNTFSLCRECHQWASRESGAFDVWRDSLLAYDARLNLVRQKVEPHRVDVARMQDILVCLKRGVFLQGDR